MNCFLVEVHLRGGNWEPLLYGFPTWQQAQDHAVSIVTLLGTAISAWRIVQQH